MRMGSERGQSTITYVISIVATLGLMGLVVDIGYAYYRRHVAEAAAESAAIAMASAAGASSGCSVTCGTNGVVCNNTPVQCPNPIPSPPTTNLHNACLYAQTNGFAVTAGGRQNVTVASGTGTPPTLTGITVPYWATVRITENIPQTFSAMLGNTWAQVSARASAGTLGGGGGGGCMYVLDPSGSGITFSGNDTIQSGCGIYVESSSSAAILSSGTNTITTNNGAFTWDHGGVTASGSLTITPAAKTYVANPSPADPFASWFSTATPPDSSHCDFNTVAQSGSGNYTLNPGVYCGTITFSGTWTITMNPGIYVLKNGISNSGSNNITGTGVFIYALSGGVNLSGSGGTTLSPMTSGTWRGITIWQPSSNSSADNLSGNNSHTISGLVYTPAATLNYSGGSGVNAPNTTLVVRDVLFSGNAYINAAASSAAGGGSCTNVTLIE